MQQIVSTYQNCIHVVFCLGWTIVTFVGYPTIIIPPHIFVAKKFSDATEIRLILLNQYHCTVHLINLIFSYQNFSNSP